MGIGRNILIGLAVIAGIGLIFFASRLERRQTVQNKTLQDVVITASAILEKDTDGDGLKDWEEELWKTDLSNPDTDGDGDNDEKEIRVGRDPLKPGPDDVLDQETIKTKVSTGTPKTLTETDKISREFFTRYLAIKREGGSIGSKDAEELSAALLEKHRLDMKAEDFALSDLVSGKPADTASVREYGNSLGEILTKNSPNISEGELDIIQRAAKADNPDTAERILKKLDPIIEGYAYILADFLKTPVPEGAETIHLSLVSNISGILEGLKGLRALSTNSIQALPALALYRESADMLAQSLAALKNYFREYRATFGAEESGYVIAELAL